MVFFKKLVRNSILSLRILVYPYENIIKKIKRSRLRQIMRGYRKLKQANQLERISSVKQALTEQPLALFSEYFSSCVLGAGADLGEVVVRQDLLCRVGGVRLTRAILLASGEAYGRIVCPLPKEWRNVLVEHDFKVDNFRSALLWQAYVFAVLVYGIIAIGKIIFSGVMSIKDKGQKKKRYVYFDGLGVGNLPHSTNRGLSYDVVSWYLQWSGKSVGVEAVRHSVANSLPSIVDDIEVVPQRRALPDLMGLKSRIGYAIWGVRASIIAAADCLRGHWWHALLLNQGALAAQVRHLRSDSLACEYLFHNSGWIYRPPWTYDAERLGSKITFYFYSTNCEGFETKRGYPQLSYGWKAMTWAHYLVWDEHQADFVRRAVGQDARISVVGPIWFQSNASDLPQLKERSIAVFDVQPFRNSVYRTFGLDFEYYIPKTTLGFLSDVEKSIKKNKGVMAIKIKRNIGNTAHPLYRRKLAQLRRLDEVVVVDPELPAMRLIANCCAVISAPFTSTALIARAMGKHSVYYDPHGLVQKGDRAAHGIPILTGAAELDDWLHSIIGE